MSIATRQWVVDHLKLQKGLGSTQETDLMNPDLTHTELIALLQGLLQQGFFIEITSVRSDHSDDTGLGEHSHGNGWCVDCWPLASFTAADYLDASDPRFQAFLKACAASPWLYQIGLAGSADTNANHVAAGPTVFSDDGADHIHLGAN